MTTYKCAKRAGQTWVDCDEELEGQETEETPSRIWGPKIDEIRVYGDSN